MFRFLTTIVHHIARFAHLAVFPAAALAAFFLRFDFEVPAAEMQHLYSAILIAFFTKTVIFSFARIHRVVWRSAGINDMLRIFWANVGASLAFALVLRITEGASFPRSVYILDFLICFTGTSAVRMAGRLYAESTMIQRRKASRKKILIYGAGQAGATLAREILTNPGLRYELVGYLDDNASKRAVRIHGVPVLGTGRRAAEIVSNLARRRTKIAEIVIAMPSAGGREMQEALANCRAAGVECKTVPGLGEILSGRILSAQIRDVAVSDLLGRAPVNIEESRVRDSIRGKRVLVTGAAGSIGSELCRQVAGFEPGDLIAFDQAESELFRIHAELTKSFPNINITPVLGDIRDAERIRDTVSRYGIQSVFHAAAYKHVPMMEDHPLEAVRNNILGTNNLVRAAYDCGVETFLMISSDKAVNPSSVMGATKRVDELILSSMPTNRTRFVSVRFGNVLGSNGSVIPTFQAQIAAGGPVTVTHPDMKRYFMTIREAVQLVLLASTMGKGSEIFVLDMGEPVKIAELARQMIRLAGKMPDDEIEIRYTGLRPGEKLYEELNTDSEQFLPTAHRKIRILQTSRPDNHVVDRWLTDFERILDRRDERGAVEYLKSIIPEFQCDSHWLQANTPKHAAASADNVGAFAPSMGD
ncbi:MAG: nucleoside-diphosphate sugar epimerase/dehydratase [Bryobacteraceae bacterium]|nr:nucleoside-diphosphate sugar epimerase/dehydratase [Bryobacteraceae bacterium]